MFASSTCFVRATFERLTAMENYRVLLCSERCQLRSNASTRTNIDKRRRPMSAARARNVKLAAQCAHSKVSEQHIQSESAKVCLWVASWCCVRNIVVVVWRKKRRNEMKRKKNCGKSKWIIKWTEKKNATINKQQHRGSFAPRERWRGQPHNTRC